MKKMFTFKDQGLFWVEVEGSVYSAFNHAANRHTFFDRTGAVLENYSRPPIQVKDPLEINDPDFLEEVGEDFYIYTTHGVTYDADGRYGLFGLKYSNGKKLTEEIYYQVGKFCNGLCAVSVEDGKWGCIDTSGRLVIPYCFCEEMFFNKFGVAVGNSTLIDRSGNELPDTVLNCIDDCGEDNRYFVFSLLDEDRLESINECGTAPDISVDIYDTKNCAYVVKGVPECRLDVHCFDGEPEVIVAAAKMLERYDKISLFKKGTLLCKKDDRITVFDYYQ